MFLQTIEYSILNLVLGYCLFIWTDTSLTSSPRVYGLTMEWAITIGTMHALYKKPTNLSTVIWFLELGIWTLDLLKFGAWLLVIYR
jgi:hypothetical protein